MISVEEFASRMGVSRSTVFAWLAKGFLAEGKIFARIGKTIRFIWSLESVASLSLKADVIVPEEECDFLKGGKSSAVNLDF